jgi:hypothetical protein
LTAVGDEDFHRADMPWGFRHFLAPSNYARDPATPTRPPFLKT